MWLAIGLAMIGFGSAGMLVIVCGVIAGGRFLLKRIGVG